MEYFAYSDTDLIKLKEKDSKLGKLIDKIPKPEREINADPFRSLVNSIISQQISGAAAASISDRLSATCFPMLSPEMILGKSDEEIISCGLGKKKTAYIKSIACAAKSGEIEINRLKLLSDEEIIKTLTKLPGVGEWTAQMFLIFCLNRQNVLSYKDFGIRRGIMKLYGLTELTKEYFEEIRTRYSPYCTLASFYLWEIAKLDVNIITIC
ncbi:MAG: DNA-3-methyladenine glycosylase [Clostridiales bacterium]|nr:DNA-3-methyladenine glycosylase [Clostridiales bacterium]